MTTRNVIVGFLFVFCSLSIFPNVSPAATVYDLATDWSDAANPNGPWSYNGNDGTAISAHQADWDPTSVLFGSAQPGWAATQFSDPLHVPVWFKRVSDTTALDIPVGVVGMHGSEGGTVAQVGVSWTSSTDATVDITGGVWQAIKGIDGVGGNHGNRSSDWRIRQNDTILTIGTLSGSDLFTSANPFDLLAGSGGVLALAGLAVSAGDVIALEFISPSTFATFNGVDLTITASVVPVPAAFWLFATALAGVGLRVRRKRIPAS